MLVHRDINNLPKFSNAAITIGTFDGVHTGHLQIINQLKEQAEKDKGESVIITFHPHPRMVLEPQQQNESKISLLNTLDEKIELLEKQGVDHLVIVPFTYDFSEQSAEQYIKSFLVDRFHPKTIIIGYDHHFGKGRKGNYILLESFQKKYDYSVKEIPQHVLHNVTISSTKIRNALLEGDIETANEFLGYSYFIEGEVVHGDKRGRTINFPTANISIDDTNKLVPSNGVYAVECQLRNEEGRTKGMMNIGVRPTFGGIKKVLEAHIFDFEKNIYGEKLRVYFRNFLRKEVKFHNVEELKTQLTIDKNNALSFFS
jgi:riboflavin kinase / FMN adenylyltransferase